MYQELDVLREKVARVLEVVGPAAPAAALPVTPRTILFTGHQIDAPDRKEPRFPPEMEAAARAAIRDAVARDASAPGGAVGLAGAASGGDILFHEVCAELGVPDHAVPRLAARSICERVGGTGRRRLDSPVLGD